MPAVAEMTREELEKAVNGQHLPIMFRVSTKERFQALSAKLKEAGSVDTHSDTLELLMSTWEAMNNADE